MVAACLPVEKKSAKETQVKHDDENENEVAPKRRWAVGCDDDGKSRDLMTSPDPERGDDDADNRPQTCASPSNNETATTATSADDGQATTTSSDGTVSPTADRKENSDKLEPETASQGAVFLLRNYKRLLKTRGWALDRVHN